jgi:hypothetical protein
MVAHDFNHVRRARRGALWRRRQLVAESNRKLDGRVWQQQLRLGRVRHRWLRRCGNDEFGRKRRYIHDEWHCRFGRLDGFGRFFGDGWLCGSGGVDR